MKMTVSVVQMDVVASNPEENLRKGTKWIEKAAERGSDIVCFPEMWTTGFNWEINRSIAGGQEDIINRISGLARKHSIWINGSMLVLNENGRVSNTSILFDSKGLIAGVYRKVHLFSLLHEQDHEEAGNSLCMVDTPWGLVGLSVCYDIRFPELFRTYALKGAGVILSPMAFPHPRIEHWKVLVRARAIENQMYIIGPNQVGTEDFGPDGSVTYFGDSVIIDPWGRTVIEGSETEEQLLTAEIDIGLVGATRDSMKVLQDRRPDLYELS
ncbi:MAG: carbon-nitrogen family hydrolase [Actinobacteria bacterium]|nr:carbon-nitrogen family hydrolase [Actinomycetota bacterium]